ncbi:MAG: hypothetical protein GWP59_04515 [Chlamydiales bacterium]|nr:hypothetical protein [Chlamydiales bacterium]
MIRDKKKLLFLFSILVTAIQYLTASIQWDFSAGVEQRYLDIEEKKDYSNYFFSQDTLGNLLMGAENSGITNQYVLKSSMINLQATANIELLDDCFSEISFAYAFSRKKRNPFTKNTNYRGNVIEVPSGNQATFSSLSQQNPSLFPSEQSLQLSNRTREYELSALYGKKYALKEDLFLKASMGYFFERTRFSYHRFLPFQSINSHGPSIKVAIEALLSPKLRIEGFSHLKLASTSSGHFSSSLLPKRPSLVFEAGVKFAHCITKDNEAPLYLGLKLQHKKGQSLKTSKLSRIYDTSQLRYVPINSEFSIRKKAYRIVFFIEKEIGA